MSTDDNDPVGLILCTNKTTTKVKYAISGMDNKLFVSKYLISLPSEKELENFIIQDRVYTNKSGTEFIHYTNKSGTEFIHSILSIDLVGGNSLNYHRINLYYIFVLLAYSGLEIGHKITIVVSKLILIILYLNSR